MRTQTLARSLATSTGIALALMAAPTQAQLVNSGDLVSAQDSAGNPNQITITNPNASTANISVLAPVVVSNWNQFNVPTNTTLNVSNASAAFQASLLARVIGGGFSNIGGTINASDVNLWLINQNGILFGSNTSVNASSFFASTLDITDADFFDFYEGTDLAGNGSADVHFVTNPAATTVLAAPTGATFTTDGTLFFASPSLDLTASFNAQSGTISYVAATDINVGFNAGSPVSYSLASGTTVSAQRVAGSITGQSAHFIVMNQASVTNAMLTIDADIATTASPTETGILIGTFHSSANSSVQLNGNVSTGGELFTTLEGGLTADKAIGAGSVFIGASKNISLQGVTATAGAIDIDSLGGGSISVGALNAATDISLDTSGSLNGTTALANGIFQVGASTDPSSVNFTGNISAASVDIDSTGAMGLQGVTATAGSIDLDGGAITTGALSASDNVYVDASGAITLASATADSDGVGGGALAVGATTLPTSLTISGGVRGSSLDLQAAGNLQLGSLTSTAGVIDLDSTGGSIAAGLVSATGGNATLTAPGAITTTSLASSDAIDVDSTGGGNLSLGNLNAGTTISLDTAGAISSGSASAGFGISVGSTVIPVSASFAGPVSAAQMSARTSGALSFNGVNQIQNITGITTGSALLLNNAVADLRISGVINNGANDVTISNTGDVTLTATGRVIGRIVALSASDQFINDRGADAITAANHWVVYSAAPTGNVYGGLDSGNTAIWNATLATRAPGSISGNRYVFAFQPIVTVTTTNLSKEYGTDLTGALGSYYSVSGLQTGVAGAFLGDTAASILSGAPTITSPGSVANADVAGGPYVMEIAQGSLVAGGGYQLILDNAGRMTITPKAINASVSANNKTYDGTPAATGTVTLNGVLAGDSVGTTGTTFTFVDKNAGTGKTVTIAGTALTGGDAGNYTLTVPASTLADIFAKAINATVGANSKTYDGTTGGTGTVTLNGVVAGDSVGTSGTIFTFSDKNAGTGKTVTISGTTLNGADAANYTLTVPATALADIFAKAINATVTANSKTYDGTTSATGTVTLNGVVAGDSVGTSGTTFTFSDKNAGTGKTVTVTGTTLTGTDAGNYMLTVPAAALADIFAKAINATVAANSKTYDGTTAGTGTVTLNGILAGDSVNTSGTTFTFSDKNAGTAKTVTVAGTTLTGTDAGNYTLTVPASALADILQRALQIVANDATKVIGKADPAFTYEIVGNGLVAGDSLSGTLARDPGEDLGDYVINQGSLSAGSNYIISYTPGTLTIERDVVADAAKAQSNPLRALPLPGDIAKSKSRILTVDVAGLCPERDEACSVQ